MASSLGLPEPPFLTCTMGTVGVWGGSNVAVFAKRLAQPGPGKALRMRARGVQRTLKPRGSIPHPTQRRCASCVPLGSPWGTPPRWSQGPHGRTPWPPPISCGPRALGLGGAEPFPGCSLGPTPSAEPVLPAQWAPGGGGGGGRKTRPKLVFMGH